MKREDPAKADAEVARYLLKVEKIGDSLGVLLPKELVSHLDLKGGDTLHVIEQSERSVTLSPCDARHAKALEIARRSFRDYADTYKTLAK
jgi:putative addiction module antidote